MCKNALLFNEEGSDIYDYATEVLETGLELIKKAQVTSSYVHSTSTYTCLSRLLSIAVLSQHVLISLSVPHVVVDEPLYEPAQTKVQLTDKIELVRMSAEEDHVSSLNFFNPDLGMTRLYIAFILLPQIGFVCVCMLCLLIAFMCFCLFDLFYARYGRLEYSHWKHYSSNHVHPPTPDRRAPLGRCNTACVLDDVVEQ